MARGNAWQEATHGKRQHKLKWNLETFEGRVR
jgi:hypothetical protein